MLARAGEKIKKQFVYVGEKYGIECSLMDIPERQFKDSEERSSYGYENAGYADDQKRIRNSQQRRQWRWSLSASSPFWAGADTGYADNRAMMFQQLPTAGAPHQFDSWEDLEAYAGDMIHFVYGILIFSRKV